MQETEQDFAAFRNGKCVAIQSVFVGSGADRENRRFYREMAGCEIRIMSRQAACDVLLTAVKEKINETT